MQFTLLPDGPYFDLVLTFELILDVESLIVTLLILIAFSSLFAVADKKECFVPANK